MTRKLVPLLAAAVIFLPAMSVAHAEPSLHQVYEATQAGNLRGAESMMSEVLHNHPNSAKAHFVEAEILAKEGLGGEANAQLATAEKLDPALSFAKPEAVQALRSELSGGHVTAPAGGGFPWGWIFAGGALIAFIVLASRWMQARATPVQVVTAGNAPYGGGYGYPGGVPTGGYGPVAPGGGGMGSGILGGLATGAAVGAGVVAGEALMHRLIDGGEHHRSVGDGDSFLPGPDANGVDPNYQLGGEDFGVNDASSWDDGSTNSGDWS
jgi:hypothetical protein